MALSTGVYPLGDCGVESERLTDATQSSVVCPPLFTRSHIRFSGFLRLQELMLSTNKHTFYCKKVHFVEDNTKTLSNSNLQMNRNSHHVTVN